MKVHYTVVSRDLAIPLNFQVVTVAPSAGRVLRLGFLYNLYINLTGWKESSPKRGEEETIIGPECIREEILHLGSGPGVRV